MNLKAHANNMALHHTIFALPFAYMATLLATDGSPSWHDLLWITLAITGARSAALVLDNLADYKYDRQQERLSYRALVSGQITKKEAKVSMALALLLFLFSVLQLRPICLYLLPIAALPFLIYPYTKRFTNFCHLVLGVAISMAPAGGWVAVGGDLTNPALWLLCASVAFWIGAFDAMYGAQDEAFDKSQGLHSLAVGFGAKNAFRIARMAHIMSIIGFFGVGMMLHLGAFYYVGVGAAAGVLVYQHRIVAWNDYRYMTQKYFMRNGLVSVAIFVCTLLSYHL